LKGVVLLHLRLAALAHDRDPLAGATNTNDAPPNLHMTGSQRTNHFKNSQRQENKTEKLTVYKTIKTNLDP
jgi:hypothetical protein